MADVGGLIAALNEFADDCLVFVRTPDGISPVQGMGLIATPLAEGVYSSIILYTEDQPMPAPGEAP